MKSDKPLILIDGSSYLHRAFHALPPLINSQGEPTGAIYGVINMIRKLLKDYEPENIAVVFDPKGKTTRHEFFPAYKAHRPPLPNELISQIKPLQEIIKAMGLPLLIIEGVEADDVIGTLAHEAVVNGMKVLISTGDKDMAQLVNDKVTLINTMTGLVLDPNGVKEKFGVTPQQIIDYLALIGDSVDNIPGVPKVGPKTAVKWLHEFDSLENIITQADKFPGKVGEYLRDSIPNLPLSKRLVTIQLDVPLAIHVTNLKRGEVDYKTLNEFFKRFEFRSWLAETLQHTPALTIAATTKHDYQTILTSQEFEKLWQQLRHAKIFAFDTETTSLDAMIAELVGVSFSLETGKAFYIPVGHDYENAPQQLSPDFLLQQLKILLEDSEKTIIGHNLKYDITVLAKYDIIIKANIVDTMLESYVLNPSSNRHDMDSLSLKYLGRHTTTFEDVAGKGAKQVTFNLVDLEKASAYACEDADVTLQLHHVFWPKISHSSDLKFVLTEIDLPLVPILAKMERYGVLVDIEKLQQLSKTFGKRIDEIEIEAQQMAGKEFNLSSPKQLQEILYQQLQIPIQKKTPTGQPSTSEAVLQELAHDYPLPKLILEHRSLSKLKSTYTDALVHQVNPNTGRVHTSYNQAITSTGRLSSTEPNLQNIPIRNEEGRRIRQAFIAPKGYKIISADYSQIELRIMAHLSQDKNLLKAFHQDSDIHRATAAEIFNVPLDQVTSNQRRGAKAINFGLMYGMSIFGLSRALGVEREIAQQYMRLYFDRYPGIQEYMEGIRILARKQGYVETLFGRRLFLPEISSSNMMRRKAAERAAINAPMQGTAADIIKAAMMKVEQWIEQSSLDVKMIMQVHDELVFEIAENDVDKAIPHIRSCMTKAIELAVPIVVEIGIGNNWDEAH